MADRVFQMTWYITNELLNLPKTTVEHIKRLNMNSKEVLEELMRYKNEYEGRLITNGEHVCEIRWVVAAPSNFHEFKERFQAYTQNNEDTVLRGYSDDYTIYFFPKSNSSEFSIPLDVFKRDYKLI